jgi:predicted acyl esterase
MAQRGTANAEGDVDTLAGYSLDAAAKIDLVELRFRWFDHVLKGGPKPEILADKINYEVTGANTWKHVPSIAAMANDSQRFYLSADASGDAHRLTAVPQRAGPMHQTIDFADRRDVDVQSPGGGVQDRALDSANGLVFISEPLAKATELSGLFSGHLDFIANKRDFDFQVALYELTAAKDYIQLAPYWARASYVKDPAHRSLLAPGKRHSLDFRSMRLMSRQLGVGSRLVAVLSILKEPEREINYGTGKEVIDESISMPEFRCG